MLKVAPIAFPGAPKDIVKRGEEILKNKLQGLDIEFTQNNPDAIFIITGGSERQAKAIVDQSKRILILAITESNSYAAASEIKSYCNKSNIDSLLYNIDNEANIINRINFYIKSKKALNQIKDQRIGLIGEVSEWLINSDIDKDIVKEKLGLILEKISWDEFPKYVSYDSNKEFIEHFQKDNNFDLTDSSKVFNLLQDIINKKNLDAITVECFPLVKENAVTACLALSKFNTTNTPAGCEGDITSIVGKIISKALVGQLPWMANLAAVEKDQLFLAHCTIATDLVSDFKINTHFETNEGTAVQGKFISENATIFRLNSDLTKAFLSYGRIVERPERNDSCRTQIKIEIPTEDVQKLKENPLGNHHLVIPGDHSELLKFFFKLVKINLI